MGVRGQRGRPSIACLIAALALLLLPAVGGAAKKTGGIKKIGGSMTLTVALQSSAYALASGDVFSNRLCTAGRSITIVRANSSVEWPAMTSPDGVFQTTVSIRSRPSSNVFTAFAKAKAIKHKGTKIMCKALASPPFTVSGG